MSYQVPKTEKEHYYKDITQNISKKFIEDIKRIASENNLDERDDYRKILKILNSEGHDNESRNI